MSADIGEITTAKPEGYQCSAGGCKGICTRYKAPKPVKMGRYAAGQKRCQICEIFISVDGLWCPCCGYRLRGKPRSSKYKARLRARLESEKEAQN